MRKVLLWGSGNDFRMIMKEAIWNENVEIIGVVESVKTKSQVVYQNRIFKIYAIDELDKLDFEKIIVANGAYKEILNTAQNNGIGFDKLIIPYHCNVKEFDVELVKKCGIYVKNAKSIIEILDEQHGYARCILCGSGRYLEFLLSIAIWSDKEQILGILDIDKNFGERESIKREIRTKHTNGDVYIKINLYSIEELQGLNYTHFIICADNEDKIKEMVKGKVGFDVKWIVPYWTVNAGKLEVMTSMRNIWMNHENVVDTMSVFHTRQTFIQPMSCDIDEFTLMNGRQENMHPLGTYNSNDYVRIRTLELLIREIKEKKIEGNMAEVGVFRGDFAKIMRCLLPEKKLYLFDTFEGFDERDFKDEIEKGNFTEEWIEVFKRTSYEEVKEYIGTEKDNIYRVGYFPETLQECDMKEEFCLVSLDADMYGPTLAGLEYFYPRLVKGGYIMIHEYNAIILDGMTVVQKLEGVRDAIRDYEKKYGHISYVPITDRNGTVIITK